jgi:sec-independent protein translocase protein TatC
MSEISTGRIIVTPTEEAPATAVSGEVLPPVEEFDGEGGVMTLREHLFELRDRVVKAGIGVGVGTIAGFALAPTVLGYFVNMICAVTPGEECRLQIIDPTEGILSYFKIALYIGISLSLPLVLYQVIRFMAPGLTRGEKRMLFTSLPFVGLLFVGGALFAISLVIPAMLVFLAGFMREFFKAEFRASTVLSLAITVTLWMGLVFEMPLVMVLLTRIGIVTWQKLLSWWRYAVVIIVIVAAIITPTPDPINMAIVAVPMMVLYVLGIGMARFFALKPRPEPIPA